MLKQSLLVMAVAGALALSAPVFAQSASTTQGSTSTQSDPSTQSQSGGSTFGQGGSGTRNDYRNGGRYNNSAQSSPSSSQSAQLVDRHP